MKKIISFMLSVLLVFSFSACKGNPSVLSDTVNSDKEIDSKDWKKTLSKYETWADDYAKFAGKYSKDIENSELSLEYSLRFAEYEEWKKTITELSNKVIFTNDTEKYSEKLSEINQKIEKANDKIKKATESK